MSKLHTTLRNIIAALAITIIPSGAHAVKFCDHGPAQKVVSTDLHLLYGGSAITQNYMGCFPEINELNSSMGSAWGVGATAEIGLRDYLSIGTQVNLLACNNSVDVAVGNLNNSSVSFVFLNNRYYYLNIPAYISFKFNLARSLRWNVDFGAYYSYGIGGNQKQTAYTSMVNDLGQSINRVTVSKPDYFRSSETFINRFLRGDIGIYIGTGLTFARHYQIGVRSMLGLKNVSSVGQNGITNPNIHNINVMMSLGYIF